MPVSRWRPWTSSRCRDVIITSTPCLIQSHLRYLRICLQLKGGDPANFLDVGGGASESQVQKAFELLNADTAVKCILVNIFGGIMRCDVIAMGVINAAQAIGMKKPIIIRLKGTNVEEAKKLIEASGFKMIVTDDLEDAADKAVHVANIVKQAEEVALGVQFIGGDSIVPL